MKRQFVKSGLIALCLMTGCGSWLPWNPNKDKGDAPTDKPSQLVFEVNPLKLNNGSQIELLGEGKKSLGVLSLDYLFLGIGSLKFTMDSGSVKSFDRSHL